MATLLVTFSRLNAAPRDKSPHGADTRTNPHKARRQQGHLTHRSPPQTAAASPTQNCCNEKERIPKESGTRRKEDGHSWPRTCQWITCHFTTQQIPKPGATAGDSDVKKKKMVGTTVFSYSWFRCHHLVDAPQFNAGAQLDRVPPFVNRSVWK